MLISCRVVTSFAAALLVLLDSASGRSSSRTPRPLIKSHRASASVIYATNGTTTITSNGTAPAVVFLDYGRNVEGIPTFEVISASGDTSVFEVSYGESRPALDKYMVSNDEQVNTGGS